MSPPTRAPEIEERREQSHQDDTARQTTAPATAPRSDEAAVLAAQTAAGNRAVATRAGAPKGVQRAPDDDPRRTSGMAHAPTLDPRPEPLPAIDSALARADTAPVPGARGPAPGAARPATPSVPAPAGGAGGGALPTVGSSPSVPGATPSGPQPVPPGMFGAVGPKLWRDVRAVAAFDGDADEAYEDDPKTVIRSPNDHWHDNAWALQKGQGPGGEDRETPRVFKVGRQYFVRQDYDGPATELPAYAAVGGPSTGAPASRATAPPTTGAADPRVLDAYGPPPDRMRHAVSPETPPGPPRGSQQAQKVTYQDVAAAFAKNPGSVIRSPNVDWHRQGYRLDGGEGGPPFAYRVGNLYIIAPTHPLQGVPTLGEGAPAKPSALPQAAQIVGLPGVAYDAKIRGRSESSALTQAGDRTEIRDRRSELTPISGQRVTGHEIREGEVTRRKESKVAGGIGSGGNLVGGTIGQTETTRVGDSLSATKDWQVGGGLTEDGTVAITGQRNKELVYGTTPAGEPLKTSSSTTGGVTYDPDSDTFGANVNRKVVGPGGTAKNIGGGVTADDKGNASASLTGGLESKSGTSITTSLSASTQVVADEPVELPDGQVEVSYQIVDSVGGSIGAGQRLGGGGAPKIGGSLGASHGTVQGGVKRFKDRREAEAWRKDAGRRLQGEKAIAQYIPPTTVGGALMIPVGETRSSGEIDSTTMGASASYAGTTAGVSKSESTTRQLSIRRASASVVEVTGSILGTKTKDASISVPVFSNTKGGTGTTSFAVTWSFDLGTPTGALAFERYCRTGLPPIPGGTLKSIDKGSSDQDHDNYKIPFLGSATWTGTTWDVSREDAAGNVEKAFGGKQSHAVKPSRVGKLLGDDEVSSDAQIVRNSENGEDQGGRAQFKVSGESGEFNRKEFGKIFAGAGGGSGAAASGEWTLSAQVPAERIRELEEVHPRLRAAWNIDEKMKIYSELVKEHGASMLGGQVGMTSKAWDLQLKGDSNFPGSAERSRLDQLKANLTAQLKARPDTAYTIAREAKETLDKLDVRLSGISDLKRYTDLPGGLRQQQIEVVRQHIRDFTQVRQRALSAGIRGGRDEKVEDIQKRASSKHGYDDVKIADRELVKLQDAIAVKEKQIAVAFVDVRNSSRALGDVVSSKGDVALRSLHTDEERTGAREAHSGAMTRIKLAFALNPKQDELRAQIQTLREAVDKETDPAARLAALKPLDKALGERLAVLKSMIDQVQVAGLIIAPYATKQAMSHRPKFWSSVGGSVDKE